MNIEFQTMYSNLALLFYTMNRRVIEDQQRQLGLAPPPPVNPVGRTWYVVNRLAEVCGFFVGRCCGQLRFWRRCQPIHVPVHIPIPVPMPIRSETGISSYAAKLIVDALVSRGEVCPVSLDPLDEFEEILVGECGHACGATDQTTKLLRCPVCRDTTVWCTIRR